MIVRSAEKSDELGIRSVLLAAFPTAAEADLVERLRAGGHAEIELLAEEQGQIVGHMLFSALEAPFRALALAPVSVAPTHQCLGIGSALIERGHQIARANGWQASFVLGETGYYGRFGYSVEAAMPFQCAYSGPHLMMLGLRGPLPVTRGELTYPSPFAELD